VANELSGLSGHSRSVYRSERRWPFGRRRKSRYGPSRFAPAGRGRRHGHTVRTGRRWPKRLLIGVVSLIVVLALLAVGSYFYLDSKLGGIHREAVPALTPEQPGKPIDILLVGSDSRSFVDNSAQARAFGSKATQTGQRSDVLIVMRLVPGSSMVDMLSIPRDTWVPIPGTGGSNKINAAFNSGPNQLVETIQHDFKIPINHVMLANFPGFAGMVDALGGIKLDFPMPVRDAYSGLDIQQTGCQLVGGQQALALVRSRHLYYYEHGAWHYDGMSDFSRIRRQQAFFHALLDRVHGVIPDVFRLNSFLGATVSDFTVDSRLSSSEMISLGWRYHSLSSSQLQTTVLPTAASVIAGQDVLLPAQPYAEDAIAHFLSSGGSTAALGPGLPAWTGKGARLASGGSPPSNVYTDTPQSLPEPWNPTPC